MLSLTAALVCSMLPLAQQAQPAVAKKGVQLQPKRYFVSLGKYSKETLRLLEDCRVQIGNQELDRKKKDALIRRNIALLTLEMLTLQAKYVTQVEKNMRGGGDSSP